CSIRLIAHTDVIWFPEPAQQVAVDFGRRAAVKQRSDREFANVAGSSIAVRLPSERVGGAGIVCGLGLQRSAGGRYRAGRRRCVRTATRNQQASKTERSGGQRAGEEV